MVANYADMHNLNNNRDNKVIKMATITSISEMEKIVSRNKSLAWDGWDVVHLYPNPVAWRDVNGVFIKGKWFTQKRFTPEHDGWTLPNKLVR